MTYRFNDLANIRQEIAIAAARMIAEEGTSYDVAKRKAARLLLGILQPECRWAGRLWSG